jgi:tripartite-type tricarboxylate transporter receptor subunit TctC
MPMPKLTRRAALALPLALPGIAAAEEAWPNRPVVMVVPWAAGGSNDVVARLIAPHLSERLGGTFVVENRSGGGGAVGMGAVVRAKPDGTMLLVSSASNHVFNQFVITDQGYDPREALDGICMLNDVPNALAVSNQLGVRNVQELIAKAKQEPGLGFASSGVGSSNHLAGELFRMLTGVDIVHVPYRGGGPVIADLISGNIPMAFLNLPTLLPPAEAGRFRIIGVGSAERVSVRPEIPTIAEQGVPGYSVRSWTGLFAPHGTPREVIEKLSNACREVLALEPVKHKLDELASVAIWTGPADTDAFVRAEFDKWGPIVRAAGVKRE